MKVLYSNPDYKTQYKNLPYGVKYPSHGIQKHQISRKARLAQIITGENKFLWYLLMSLMHLSI